MDQSNYTVAGASAQSWALGPKARPGEVAVPARPTVRLASSAAQKWRDMSDSSGVHQPEKLHGDSSGGHQPE
eukprot:9338557-Alexandrium_andersonii.AAC.1